MALASIRHQRYQTDLDGIKGAGLFKTGALYPLAAVVGNTNGVSAGSATRKCINICANNYLGLSSHPEVIAAAHAGLAARGYDTRASAARKTFTGIIFFF